MRTFAQKPKATQQTTSAKSTIPGQAHFGQSREVNSILHLQRTIVNQAVPRLLQAKSDGLEAVSDATASGRFGHDFSRIPVHAKASVKIQSKLAVNTSGDIYEQEAEHISEQVMRMPEPQLQRACPCGGGCPKCQTEQPDHEHERLQTKRVQASETGQIATPPIVQEVLAAPGQPLDPATRGFMEQRFGHDFSKVRVHSDATAEQSARDVSAHAYTVGHDIVFGAGRFAPETPDGRRLIAHELAHVVQQSGGKSTPSLLLQRQPSSAPTGQKKTRSPKKSSVAPARELMRELKRVGDEAWELTLEGYTDAGAVGSYIWPSGPPPGVRIAPLIVVEKPVQRGLLFGWCITGRVHDRSVVGLMIG